VIPCHSTPATISTMAMAMTSLASTPSSCGVSSAIALHPRTLRWLIALARLESPGTDQKLIG
jgi:hypothetical protein